MLFLKWRYLFLGAHQFLRLNHYRSWYCLGSWFLKLRHRLWLNLWVVRDVFEWLFMCCNTWSNISITLRSNLRDLLHRYAKVVNLRLIVFLFGCLVRWYQLRHCLSFLLILLCSSSYISCLRFMTSRKQHIFSVKPYLIVVFFKHWIFIFRNWFLHEVIASRLVGGEIN